MNLHSQAPAAVPHAKKNIADLAIFGGEPAFRETLHVGRPNLSGRARLMSRIETMLDSHWLTNDGPLVREFEQQIAAVAGTRHAIATCSGTTALQLAIRGLGLRDEVILPSFTFIASAHALYWEGVTPVFADISERDYCIDPAQIEPLITPNTSAILPVHVYGQVCDVGAIAEIARRHDMPVLYDAAHAFGVTQGGKSIGGFGRASVFSFHATKFLHSSEGGAIVTDDDRLAKSLRSMRNFGFAGEDNVTSIGINGKMPEIAAAFGLTSLEEMDHVLSVNRRNYDEYCRQLTGIPGISGIRFAAEDKSNYQYVVIEIDAEAAGLDRDTLHRLISAEGVLVRRYFYPGCHRSEPYKSMSPGIAKRLPRTERAITRVLSLPTGLAITPVQIAALCGLIRFAVAHADEIRARIT